VILARLRASDPAQPLFNAAFYRLCRKIVALAVRTLYRLQVRGREHIPPAGGLLIVSNHQSHLDPPLIGTALGRRNMAAIARAGLFRHPLMGLLLRGLGAISLRQEEGDAGAMRAAIAELKKGRVLLIFPEGSRSPDGTIHPFKRGTWLLLSRSGCTVLPTAVEGAFDAWPRGRPLPRIIGCRCAVAFGEPISFEDLKKLGPDAGLELLAQRIDTLRLGLRAELRTSTDGRLPRPGPADRPRTATA
jgi:1-acyl-sn-glycerol-3-phosphate acyltransferase